MPGDELPKTPPKTPDKPTKPDDVAHITHKAKKLEVKEPVSYLSWFCKLLAVMFYRQYFYSAKLHRVQLLDQELIAYYYSSCSSLRGEGHSVAGWGMVGSVTAADCGV